MPSELGQEFNDVPRYPYMAVASPSCHDTTTTRSWWEEDAGRRERFFGEELHMQVVLHTDMTANGHCCANRAIPDTVSSDQAQRKDRSFISHSVGCESWENVHACYNRRSVPEGYLRWPTMRRVAPSCCSKPTCDCAILMCRARRRSGARRR